MLWKAGIRVRTRGNVAATQTFRPLLMEISKKKTKDEPVTDDLHYYLVVIQEASGPHPVSTFSQAALTVSLATAGNLGDTGGDMLHSVGVARA